MKELLLSICVVLMTACGPSESEQKLANEVLELKASKIQQEADQRLAMAKLRDDFTTQLDGLNDRHQKEKANGESIINDLRERAQLASTNEKILKKGLDDALTASSAKDGSITNLQAQVLSLKKGAAQAKEQIDQANISMLTAQAAAKSLSAQLAQAQAAAKSANKQLAQAQAAANQIPALKGQIAAFENLGSPQNIKIKLNRLAKLEGATRPFANPKKGPPTKALIKFYNSELDYYVISKGSADGIKRGDKFIVLRAGEAIGKIEITRSQPLASIAVHQKGFPKPSTPFKLNDEVMKIK